MSKQGMTALFERAQSDEAFKDRLENASSPHEKQLIVSEAGFDVDRDDLDTLRSLAGMTELSDEDLERVSGGGSTTAASVLATAAPVAGAAAAAAAV